jgi:hypothetical protein
MMTRESTVPHSLSRRRSVCLSISLLSWDALEGAFEIKEEGRGEDKREILMEGLSTG